MSITEGLYAVIISIIVGVLGYIYKLQRKNTNLQDRISELNIDKELLEYQELLNKAITKVTESERDYNEKKDNFNRTNKPTDDSDSKS